ncbi:MAG: protein translocase subunit SecF, partial [Calditrichia bacterium]
MRFFRNPKIDFISSRKLAYALSGTLILISIISLIIHGGPRYSVDFRGGTFVEIRFEDKTDVNKALDIPIKQVRSVFDQYGYGDSEIKHYGSHQEVAVRMDLSENVEEVVAPILTGLREIFPDYNVIEMRRETVGPKIG